MTAEKSLGAVSCWRCLKAKTKNIGKLGGYFGYCINHLVTKVHALLRILQGLNSLISISWAHRHVSRLKMNIGAVTTLGCFDSASDQPREIALFQISPWFYCSFFLPNM